jgi:hypothetical protein
MDDRRRGDTLHCRQMPDTVPLMIRGTGRNTHENARCGAHKQKQNFAAGTRATKLLQAGRAIGGFGRRCPQRPQVIVLSGKAGPWS